MKTNNKLSAYILRGSTTALLFSYVIVALCSAINLPEQPPKARPPLQLRAQQKRVERINTVRLAWKGATSPNIDIYRNNVLIATQPNNPGVYIDSTGDTSRARYRYRVCEAGTQTCSNEVLVRFPQ